MSVVPNGILYSLAKSVAATGGRAHTREPFHRLIILPTWRQQVEQGRQENDLPKQTW